MAMSKTIGQKIHLLRLERNWTRKVLAERSGLTAQTIYLIEFQRTHPRWPTLEMIAAAFGMTISELYVGVGEPQ